MAVSSSHVARRPLTPPIVYLGAGVLLGPIGLGLIDAGWREHGRVVETLGELLVALALFCIGLRLRQALEWRAWRVPVRLSTITTVATATLVAGTAHVFFDLDFAHALLLGAILAPTDPVLARDVPLPLESDTESVRTTLVGEGALNQAVALSVLLFALGRSIRPSLCPYCCSRSGSPAFTSSDRWRCAGRWSTSYGRSPAVRRSDG